MRGRQRITEEESAAYYGEWINGKSIMEIATKFSRDHRAVARNLEKEMARRQMMKSIEKNKKQSVIELAACA